MDAGFCGDGPFYDSGTGLLLRRAGEEKEFPLHDNDELRLLGTYKCIMGSLWL